MSHGPHPIRRHNIVRNVWKCMHIFVYIALLYIACVLRLSRSREKGKAWSPPLLGGGERYHLTNGSKAKDHSPYLKLRYALSALIDASHCRSPHEKSEIDTHRDEVFTSTTNHEAYLQEEYPIWKFSNHEYNTSSNIRCLGIRQRCHLPRGFCIIAQILWCAWSHPFLQKTSLHHLQHQPTIALCTSYSLLWS